MKYNPWARGSQRRKDKLKLMRERLIAQVPAWSGAERSPGRRGDRTLRGISERVHAERAVKIAT
jgi:hypothetical protein